MLVREVLPGGAAHRAGVRTNDIIFRKNGRDVEAVDAVHRLLFLFPFDARIELELLRGDQRLHRFLD